MARRGASYRQILAKYFPGTFRSQHLAGQEGGFTPADSHRQASGGKPPFLTFEFTQPERFNSRSQHRPAARRTMSSEHFRISYPEANSQQGVDHVLRLLESSRSDLLRRVSAADVSVQFPVLELFINETTGDFVGRTGQPAWAAAATRGKRVELQPLELLKRRRILETTLRHELVHVVVDAIGHGTTPRWLAEGLALYIAGEGKMVSRYDTGRLSGAEIDEKLNQTTSPDEMRAAYAAAHREVHKLITAEGEPALWRRVALRTGQLQ